MKDGSDMQHFPQPVLVVDDDPLICWSIAQTLGSCGDTVTEARTGKDGPTGDARGSRDASATAILARRD
jgi:CheY-like chemotaxis protein